MRFGCPIIELNDAFSGTDFAVFNDVIANEGLIGGLLAKGCAGYSRKQIDALTEFVKAPHRGGGGLIYIRYNEDGSIKSSVDKFFSSEQLESILKAHDASPGDMLLIVADKKKKTRKILGDLRLELAARESWIPKDSWSVFWVVDMPMFEEDETTGDPIFAHHPFCAPHPDDVDLFDSEPLRIRAQSYDLVMNGNEILSGSIRIHNADLQNKIFNILGFSEQEIQERFGFMVNAFQYGAPPHGGCAFGLDRWVMLMAGGNSIRDVIAFPKNNGGKDLMMDAPAMVDEQQLELLGLTVRRDQHS